MPKGVLQPAAGVSTHSRLKAAGNSERENAAKEYVSTHSRLKAAGMSKLLFIQST